MKTPVMLIILMISINLSACHTTGNVVPKNGPSMEQVYDSMRGSSISKKRKQHRNLVQEEERFSSFNQANSNQMTSAFTKISNPELKLYIYPHFSGTEEVPIPGYATVFNAYERDHYTLVNV